MITLREQAHIYLENGWNIFPLGSMSKRPNFKCLVDTGFWELNEKREKVAKWEQFQTQKVTKDLIDKWWTIDPNANIGLICGKISGVTVIDIDIKNIPENELVPAEKIRWKICDATLTSITGTGGLHLFCKYAPGVPNSKKRVHPQIDIKNDGGYVLLPPSIHDETGLAYEFDVLTPFNSGNLEALAVFPQTLKDKIIERNNGKMTRDDWTQIFSEVRESIDGRNNIGTQVLGKLIWAVFLEFEKDERFIPYLWDFMQWWNERSCKPPLKKPELKSMFKSIINRAL